MQYTDNKIKQYYKIWISLINGIGIKKFNSLIKKFNTIEEIYKASREELLNTKGISEKICNEILDINTRTIAKNNLEYMYKNNIGIISIEDKLYPDDLKEIYDSPIVLYYRGNINLLNKKNIAIIGCRECTKYGEEIAKKFSYNIANNEINVVSGLARGIDSYAHLGSLYSKGNTIAVLANGLDIIYPSENKKLANKILEKNGLIISEYPIGTKPIKQNFPARNRIISGISKAVLVVEAKLKSGTMITVDFALEQGKDVFVIPR